MWDASQTFARIRPWDYCFLLQGVGCIAVNCCGGSEEATKRDYRCGGGRYWLAIMLRLQCSGGQALLLRGKAVVSGGGEESSTGDGVLFRVGLRRWRGKMEWRRRDEGYEWKWVW